MKQIVLSMILLALVQSEAPGKDFTLYRGSMTGELFMKMSYREQLIYMKGFLDAMAIAPAIVRDESPHKAIVATILSEKVPEGTVTLLVTKYVETHPEQARSPMNALCLLALEEEFGRKTEMKGR